MEEIEKMDFKYCKLEIFIPETHITQLQKALQSVDAGHIGKYDSCMSCSQLISYWRPLDGTDPYIGKAGEKEIDFVAENKEGFTYFQVAYTTREKATLERELTPLQDINDHYPKYILTMDIDPIADYDGIKKVNVLDWLLEK